MPGVYDIKPHPEYWIEYLGIISDLTELQRIHPRKQTWNLKMDPSKRRFLLETTIFRFYVKFRGSTTALFVPCEI